MDRLFEVERTINGQSSQDRLMARQERSAPMVDELQALMLTHRPGLSRNDDLAKAMDYMLKRWPSDRRCRNGWFPVPRSFSQFLHQCLCGRDVPALA